MSTDVDFNRLYKLLGERVAAARGGTLSQARLAAAVGVSRASIVNIEAGRQRPPLHLLWQIAAALGREAKDFIPSTSEVEALIGTARLTPQALKQIELAARDDDETKALLTEFVQRATARISKDGKSG